eukprot:scaffold23707_cov49-Phaeocystis_antarctica.AAC.2
MPPTEEEREASTLDVASQQIFAMLEAFPRFKDLAADGMRPADVAADARGCIVFTGPLKMLQVRRPRYRHCDTIPGDGGDGDAGWQGVHRAGALQAATLTLTLSLSLTLTLTLTLTRSASSRSSRAASGSLRTRSWESSSPTRPAPRYTHALEYTSTGNGANPDPDPHPNQGLVERLRAHDPSTQYVFVLAAQ